jgi:hypothetical protein
MLDVNDRFWGGNSIQLSSHTGPPEHLLSAGDKSSCKTVKGVQQVN